ncbi:MAG: serine/threonine-protein phosphatase [Pirellulaceae bacterium]|nr:serine/threonine-protein phosphatase [Pirellulaceae bacterium]
MAVALAASQERFDSRGHLFMVADGMGAHAAGELASKLATDVVPLTYHKLVDLSPPEALKEAVLQANRYINGRGEADLEFRGMGTTVDTLVILPQGALIAHVGDSRVYRLREECLEQLTFDHSLVWEMRAAGHLSENEEDIPSFIPRNVITRSMGPNPEVQADLEGPFPVQTGDTFLLCSDGLSGQLSDCRIGQILGCLEPGEAAQALVHVANLRGGPDNITVVIARITGPQRTLDSPKQKANFENGNGTPRPVHPIIWGLLGILPSLGGVFALANSPKVALALLLAAFLVGCGALIYRYTKPHRMVFDSRPRGKGPYRQTLCSPDAEFIDWVRDLVNQLREAAEKESWHVDWQPIHPHQEAGETATRDADFVKAGREYLRVICQIMGQVRQRQTRNEPDRAAGIF